jgi:hypothetical protein
MIWSDRIGDCQVSVVRLAGGYRARVVYCGELVYSDMHDTITVAKLSCERVALSWLYNVTALALIFAHLENVGLNRRKGGHP